jgi:hypothetical protein
VLLALYSDLVASVIPDHRAEIKTADRHPKRSRRRERYGSSPVRSDRLFCASTVPFEHRARNYEGHSKDYEFSRASMEERWRTGYHDARRTLRHPEVLERPKNHEGLFTFDLAQDSRE